MSTKKKTGNGVGKRLLIGVIVIALIVLAAVAGAKILKSTTGKPPVTEAPSTLPGPGTQVVTNIHG